ncbi:MAG: 1-deoxy-D-xylulose-5-phosphate synthase [Planctomycetes bacterium]|nr:1-deoxy-D-xylulose-5-phosphate synthase [Planctomycetota bacterium]
MSPQPDSASPTPLFDRIQYPQDLKQLGVDQLPQLAQELRHVILDTVQVTGGHLGSSMGVVELTIALHYVFDFANDRLIFDVGHQSYPHKLLTGRKDRFHTLRQKHGLCGFTNRFESDFDVYTFGHAGTATSTALGLTVGDRLLGRQRHVVAVVGDAAMGCGVAFEALNHGGSLEKDRLLVILNDNRWSIAKTVGALARYLNRVRTGSLYNQAKKTVHQLIQSIPLIGKDLDERLEDIADTMRNIVHPGHVFEALGFTYFGPIDGHDLKDSVETLQRLKDRGGVALLHVRTEKGRGVPGSEDAYDRAHAAKPRPKAEPVPMEPCVVLPAKAPAKGKSWTQWFAEGVEELAEQDARVVAITAAMPDGTGLMKFRERFPERFVDAGIAEQHAVAFASGLATAGMRPVAAIYSTFLQRGYDQVFQEVALQKVPVVFALDRAGLVGEDGPTHNGAFDIAYLRTLPGMVLMAPKDGPELKQMLRFGLGLGAPSAVRYPRGDAPGAAELPGCEGESLPLELGRMEVLRRGKDGAILAYGHMVQVALEAAALLDKRGVHVEVVNARFAKPLDAEGILGLADRHDRVLTLEDHAVMGGFGSAVLECIAQHGPVRAQFQVAGIPDLFPEHASRKQLLEELGLDARGVAARFLSGTLSGRPL